MKKNHSDTSGLDNILRELSARIKELMLTQKEREKRRGVLQCNTFFNNL